MTLNSYNVRQIHSPISGLVCVADFRRLSGRKTPSMISVICNPSTGQSFTLLPRMKRKRYERRFFGHDPIEKQLKVLSMTWSDGNAISEEHQVLTLETGKLSWRMIECNIPHYPGYNSVCIDGVLYYIATPNQSSSSDDIMIICFDVRYEKYKAERFIGAVQRESTLINYHGKLASLTPRGSNFFTSFEMWVLVDPKKKESSKHSYELPPQWQTIFPMSVLNFVGVTGSNEIVFSKKYASNPFYVFYYSLEKETIRRVEIQGIGEFVKHRVYTFLNHVEDMKLMKGIL